jgi:hypothetical protein
MILFRKELYSPELPRRCLAIYGVCLMLSEGVLHEAQQQLDALVLLKPLLASDPKVRTEVYVMLHTIISQSKTDCEEGALSSDARFLLHEILTWRMRRCLVHTLQDTPGHGKGQQGPSANMRIRLDACFEFVRLGDVQRWRSRENLCMLVKCFAATSRHNVEASVVMRGLVQQLSCPGEVAALITGNKIDSDVQAAHSQASSTIQSQAPSHVELDSSSRIAMLLTLYDVLVEECCTKTVPEWATNVSKIWGNTCPSRVWMFMYSIVSRLANGSESLPRDWHAESDMTASDVNTPLAATERLCEIFADSGACCTSTRRTTTSSFAQQTPFLCRQLERMLAQANHQESSSRDGHRSENEQCDAPSTSSGGLGRSRISTTAGAGAFPWTRVLSCAVRVYQRSHTRPVDNTTRSTRPRTRASLTRDECCDERTQAATDCANADEEVREDSTVSILADVEKDLEEALRELNYVCENNEKQRAGYVEYHRVRHMLLQIMRLCMSKGCTSTQLLNSFRSNLPPGLRDQPDNSSNRGKSNNCDDDNNNSTHKKRNNHEKSSDNISDNDDNDGDDAVRETEERRLLSAVASPHIICAQYLCQKLYTEAEQGVSLAVLTEYLDLIHTLHKSSCHTSSSAVQASHSGGRQVHITWEDICRKLVELLAHFDISKVQVVRRILVLTMESLDLVQATQFCLHVLHRVFSIDEEETQNHAHIFRQDISHTTSAMEHEPWELPDCDSPAIRNCATGACLKHLLAFFSVSQTSQESCGAYLWLSMQSLIVVTETNKQALDVAISVRAMMMRLGKKVLAWYSDMLTQYLNKDSKSRSSTHRMLVLARQILTCTDTLVTCLRSVPTAATGVAQLRHAAYKCGTQIAAFLPSVARNGDSAPLVRDIEGFIQGMIRGVGDDAAAADEMDMVESRAVRKGSRKRNRLRSRNAYVDAGLAEEDGDDDYGDLEDFIVCKDGALY